MGTNVHLTSDAGFKKKSLGSEREFLATRIPGGTASAPSTSVQTCGANHNHGDQPSVHKSLIKRARAVQFFVVMVVVVAIFPVAATRRARASEKPPLQPMQADFGPFICKTGVVFHGRLHEDLIDFGVVAVVKVLTRHLPRARQT